jgi:UDP-N-acetylmuramoyl-L-alanyl-D-glutamate--2,6-diaminopimelate ligase
MEVTDQTVVIETDIIGLTCDSRRVEPGFLFAALPGTERDGRDFISDALDRGAAAVLSLPGTDIGKAGDLSIPLLSHANPRRQYALMAAAFYQVQPDMIAAVTGTNGKTSVVTFLRQIWDGLGRKAASAGTLGVVARGFENRKSLTTPDSAELHRNLRDLAHFGVDRLALEASSHGLMQHRLDGVRVSLAAFTNLTRDHLDYHGDMEEYLAAKLRLFTEILSPEGTAVINADGDPGGAVEEACRERGLRIMSYGQAGSDVGLEESEAEDEGYRLGIAIGGKTHRLRLPLLGLFQVSNALCALSLAVASGEDAVACMGQLEQLQGVPGRVQLAGSHANGAGIFVDYAHTPAALMSVLEALRPHASGRLHVVFGCGGDRDAGKRPEMGAIANSHADGVIVTDDNPRTEDATEIRRQILARVPRAVEIADREEAIAEGIKGLEAGDILVIAGKGHERGQIVGTETRPFDDVQVVRDVLRRMPA